MQDNPRGLTGAGIALVAAFLAGLALWWASRPVPPPPPPPPPPEERLTLKPVTFADLAGWTADDVAQALPALLRTCTRWQGRPDDRPLGGEDFAGRLADWREPCAAAAALDPADGEAARRFFETAFRPYAVSFGATDTGLFTGYYEPLLHGARKGDAHYRYPLYGTPEDLITVDLGRFRENLKGEQIVGRVAGRKFVPYYDRVEIDGGALAGRGLEFVWVDDPVDAFFLQIQGSGRIALDDGSELRVGYAGKNGHAYYAIGRELIRRGVLTAENVSMQSIRAWLEANPAEAKDVLHLNRSYVFFRPLEGDGPIGAASVALTPGRSLAVDRSFIPLGVPIWLDASAPSGAGGQDRPLQRLMLAQDTGGAIRGAIRGDVFWGHGTEAEEVAGRMKHEGRWYVLLPRGLAVPGAAPQS